MEESPIRWLSALLPHRYGGVASCAQVYLARFIQHTVTFMQVVTPTGGFTIVANIWFSRLCLAEQMTRRDQVATCIIVVGIILIAVGGTKESTCYTLDDLVVRT